MSENQSEMKYLKGELEKIVKRIDSLSETPPVYEKKEAEGRAEAGEHDPQTLKHRLDEIKGVLRQIEKETPVYYNLWFSHQYRNRAGHSVQVPVVSGPAAKKLRDVILRIFDTNCDSSGRLGYARFEIAQLFEDKPGCPYPL